MKVVYPAVFEKDSVGYGVYFPDVEDAITQGGNKLEAMENASDALGIMLSYRIEHDEKLPIPTELNHIKTIHSSDIVTLISVDLDDYV